MNCVARSRTPRSGSQHDAERKGFRSSASNPRNWPVRRTIGKQTARFCNKKYLLKARFQIIRVLPESPFQVTACPRRRVSRQADHLQKALTARHPDYARRLIQMVVPKAELFKEKLRLYYSPEILMETLTLSGSEGKSVIWTLPPWEVRGTIGNGSPQDSEIANPLKRLFSFVCPRPATGAFIRKF